MLTCGLTNLNGTPVFAVPTSVPRGKIERVFGAVRVPELGLWLMPAFYPYLMDVVHDLNAVFGDELKLSPEAHQHYDRCMRNGTAIRDDFAFVTTPQAHQLEALLYVLRNLRCGILYDMGLGKTKIAIDLIRHEREKTLVLAPVVGVLTWMQELKKHTRPGELSALAISGDKAKKKALIAKAAEHDVLIVGYDTAKRYTQEIIDAFPYKIIIADESHNLRDRFSERTKAAVNLASQAKRRIIMSGTPSLGNPLHLYGQLYFLAPYIPGRNYWEFRKMYTIAASYNKHIIVGYKNIDLLNAKVRRICLRKTKEECLDLPDRSIIDYPFEVSTEQRKVYNQLVEEACVDLENGKLYEAPHAAAVIQKLLQILSGFFIEPPPNICDGCMYMHSCVEEKIQPYTKRCMKASTAPPRKVHWLKQNAKLEALEELLDGILAEDRNKVIIWGYFIAELDSVEQLLKNKQIGYVRVDGSNSQRAQEIAAKFNADPNIRVYLGQIATGVALTLTSAAYTIYYGLSFKLDEYLQSMDRNYRIGQTQKVFVYRLICPKSILHFVAKALAQKEDIANNLTARINCAFCDQAEERQCLENKIQPFTEGCVYKNRASRVIMRPKLL